MPPPGRPEAPRARAAAEAACGPLAARRPQARGTAIVRPDSNAARESSPDDPAVRSGTDEHDRPSDPRLIVDVPRCYRRVRVSHERVIFRSARGVADEIADLGSRDVDLLITWTCAQVIRYPGSVNGTQRPISALRQTLEVGRGAGSTEEQQAKECVGTRRSRAATARSPRRARRSLTAPRGRRSQARVPPRSRAEEHERRERLRQTPHPVSGRRPGSALQARGARKKRRRPLPRI